jgi:drug/metabolite transporter (DMT)-like permease
VVWSFLLLAETLRVGQILGIAIAIGGLAAFLWLNQRGEQQRRREARLELPLTPEGSVSPPGP